MPPPPATLVDACFALYREITFKCSKLNVHLGVELPHAFTLAHAAQTQWQSAAHGKRTPASDARGVAQTHAQELALSSAPRDLWALTYDVLFAALEEVLLVESRRKHGVEQAAAYLKNLALVWSPSSSPDATIFLKNDACQFWVSSFPSGIVAVTWLDMENKLQKWAQSLNYSFPCIWPNSTDNKPTPAARALRLRLEGCLSGYVSILSLALFVYKSTLKDSLTNFCAEEPWTPSTADIIVTIGFPKDTEISLEKYHFRVVNIPDWMDFKIWLFAQKELRSMMKTEPNVVEFIVNNAIHPGTNSLGEEIVRFLRGRRFLSPVTIVGLPDTLIKHNYEHLYLANSLSNVWSLNRYHRSEFKSVADNSISLLKTAPKHHVSELVDTFTYKNKNLPAIPPVMCHLKWMRILILEDNSLEQLPIAIGLLTNLFRLTLTSNRLQYLPASISELTQLKELFINKNRFVSLPNHLCKLAGLRVLNVSSNPLTSLPSDISLFTNLEDLDIQNIPELTQLPSTMGDMTKLQQFRMDKYSFQSYPRGFTGGYATDKLKFLKDLQPGYVPGLQQIIILGKDAYDVIKSLGTNTRKVGHNLFEVDMPNPKRPEEFVTLVVWDFSGRENNPENTKINSIVPTINAMFKNAYTIGVYAIPQTSKEDANEISRDSPCFRCLFLNNKDYKEELYQVLQLVDRPEIYKPHLQFSRYLLEQSKMFMSLNELQFHASNYSPDVFNTLSFLHKNGYLNIYGAVPDYLQKINDGCVALLPSLIMLVNQLKSSIKRFEMVKKTHLLATIQRLCLDEVNFQLVIELLEKFNVVHSIDREISHLFFIMNITWFGYQSTLDISYYRINLVRAYTVAKGSNSTFSLEWFLNVITGIHSKCEGVKILDAIDSNNAIITFEFAPHSPENPLSRSDPLSSSPPSNSPTNGSSSPTRVNTPVKSRSAARLFSFRPSHRSSPPSSPPVHQSPLSSSSSSISPIALSIRCFLHLEPDNRRFWFILSSPSLAPQAFSVFQTTLRIIQWLINHWIENAFINFHSTCYKCFEKQMSSFINNKTAKCSIRVSDCVCAIQENRPLVCSECNESLDMSFVFPEFVLPAALDHSISEPNLSTLLKSGGNGNIYTYTMPSGYKAAVKTTKASEMDKHVFIKEMALTSSLQHSNIITCLGLSKAPTLAMILEFAERKSLNDLILEKFHELSQPRFTTRIALEIAEAMRFLHECGITNQDLKSQNVLLMSVDWRRGGAMAKLTDFGTSEHHMGFSAKFNTCWTPCYTSPESCRGLDPVDMLLADIFCFGLILWELLAGVTVEERVKEKKEEGVKINDSEIFRLFTADTLPPQASNNQLFSLLKDCLQEFPSKRIQTFGEIETRIRGITR